MTTLWLILNIKWTSNFYLFIIIKFFGDTVQHMGS